MSERLGRSLCFLVGWMFPTSAFEKASFLPGVIIVYIIICLYGKDESHVNRLLFPMDSNTKRKLVMLPSSRFIFVPETIAQVCVLYRTVLCNAYSRSNMHYWQSYAQLPSLKMVRSFENDYTRSGVGQQPRYLICSRHFNLAKISRSMPYCFWFIYIVLVHVDRSFV